MSYEIKNLAHTAQNELGRQFYFDNNISSGSIEEIFIEKGLTCIKSDIHFKEDCLFDIVGKSKHIMLNYVLSGEHEYSSSCSNINMKKDTTSIVIDNNSVGKKHYKKRVHFKSIQIILEEKYFLRTLHEFLQNYNFLGTSQDSFTKCLVLKTTDIRTKLNIDDIFHFHPNDLNSFFVKSKIFEVLYEEFKNLTFLDKANQANIKFSSYDMSALEKAKQILIHKMQNPPSIYELSKQINLNEFKLKIGFKVFYKTTPYKFLFEYKMNYAKQLLLQDELNINEISQKIGFKHSSSFTTAFKKKFKINPNQYRRK